MKIAHERRVRVRLRDHSDVAAQMAFIYRQARAEKIPVDEALKLMTMLGQLSQMLSRQVSSDDTSAQSADA